MWELKTAINDEMKNIYFFVDEAGRESEQYAFAKPYVDGYALVKKEKNGKFYFRDDKGTLSEPFGKATSYYNGFAIVNDGSVGDKYRDINGNLSEEFYIARPYHNGVALVSRFGEPYRFRDSNGVLSKDSFIDATGYSKDANGFEEGFSYVQKSADSVYQFRDLLGNLSDEPTLIGREYLEYISNKKTVFDLADECFSNQKMLDAIINREQNMLLQAVEHCEKDEEFDYIRELLDYTSEFIKGKAYDAYLKEEEIRKLEESSKITLEDIKNNVQEEIAKMF